MKLHDDLFLLMKHISTSKSPSVKKVDSITVSVRPIETSTLSKTYMQKNS